MAARSTAKPTLRPAPPQAPDARSRLRGRNVALALDELRYFTTHVDILGVYPADAARRE